MEKKKGNCSIAQNKPGFPSKTLLEEEDTEEEEEEDAEEEDFAEGGGGVPREERGPFTKLVPILFGP